jgi:hypothetical protein
VPHRSSPCSPHGCAAGSGAASCVDYPAWEIPIAHSFAPNSVYELVHRDGLLYGACQESGLRIFKETSPGLFTDIGGVATPYRSSRLAVEDGWAYLSAGSSGLQIADVSDPATPVLVADVPLPWAGAVDVEGGYVYVAIGLAYSGLRIVDVSNPALPVDLGTWNPGNDTVGSILVEGSLGYFGVQDGLVFADLTSPAAPVTLGKLPTGSGVKDVFPHGGLVYVAAGTDGLLIVDGADPAAPVVVGSLTLSGYQDRVTVVGDRAYLVASGYSVSVVDVSDASDPRYLGWVPVGQANDVIPVGSNVVAGVHVPVAGQGDLASFPAAGLEWPPTADVLGEGSVSDMEEEGDHLYLVRDGVEVWDVSDPAAGVLLGAAAAPGPNTWYMSIGVSGGTALATARISDGPEPRYAVHAFDVSDPTAPQYGSAYSAGFGWFADGEVENGYGFVLRDGNSLAVLDVSDPYALSWVTSAPTTVSSAKRVEVAAGFAYVTAEGLEIFDVSDPPAPSSISYLPIPSGSYYVAVQGDLAYVGTRDDLHVVDVSDRHAPSILGSVDLSSLPCGFSYGVAARGEFVYVPCGESAVVVDVSVPEAPVVVGSSYGSVPRTIDVAAPGSDVVYLAGSDGVFPMWLQCGADATAASVREAWAGGLRTWPNPFGALTTFDFDVARGGAVRGQN